MMGSQENVLTKSSTNWLDRIASNSSHRLLAFSFLWLFLSIWSKGDPIVSKALFLVHIGLFLFWQPFVSHKTQIQTRPTIILILALLGIIYLGGGWAQMIWIVFLMGILSSYRLSNLQDKLIFLLIIGFLLIELFGDLIPVTLLGSKDLLISTTSINYLALGLIVLAILLPSKTGSFRNYASDLLYSIIAIAVVVLLAMATLLWMFYGKYDYYISLILSLMTLACVLIIFNLIFRSSSDISLLAQFTDRYALNLGTPFESFLLEAAALSEQTEDPDDYLKQAFTSLCKLDWVRGFEWRAEHSSGEIGSDCSHTSEFEFDTLKVTLYSQQKLGDAMQTHAKLLLKLVEIFYTAKRRELSLSRSAHMEAIYETGARLTHDIKNLLQSLTLMLSATNAKPMTAEDSKLFFKNLEIITQRLQITLLKLRNPETLSRNSVSLENWWSDIKQRESSNNFVHFVEEISEGIEIPEELFNSVFENLVDNAKKKRRREPNINIEVKLTSTLDTLKLEVRDSGSEVPERVAKYLLEGPVKSRSGFGIGLYQAAKQAAAHGYKLLLEENQAGAVCFALKKS
jgi:signal transduction histidine kinase